MDNSAALQEISEFNSLKDLNDYLYVLLKTMVKKRYYFIYDKEISNDELFIKRSDEKVKMLVRNVNMAFFKLREKGFFRIF